jgi:chromosome segregation ATPase
LLGHKVKGVDKHYSNHEIDEFLRAYLDALPWLIPQTVEQVKAETEKKLEADEIQINDIKYQNNTLKREVNGLQERDKVRDKEIADLWAMMQRLSDTQRKNLEAQMQKNEAEAQERERQEREEIMAKSQAEDEEIIKENLKKFPKIIEEDKNKKELSRTE